MAFQNYEEPPTAGGRAEKLPIGWHTLQITDGSITYGNGKQRLRFVVRCVGASAPGATFGFRKQDTDAIVGGLSGTIGTSWYDDLARSCEVYGHDWEKMTEREILSLFLARVFRAECKPDRDPQYLTLGWPGRPSDDQKDEAVDYFDFVLLAKYDGPAKAAAAASETRTSAPPEAGPDHYNADDDLPF